MRRIQWIKLLPSILLASAAGCASHALPDSRTSVPDEDLGISAEALRRDVEVLASDAMEGRGAGYPGERKAAALIVARFRQAGLKTDLQTFDFPPRSPGRFGQILRSQNVLAVLPGGDPRLRGEAIVLGAHYDGQGMAGQADGGRYPSTDPALPPDNIWNSADDNASSVAAILQIAHVLARRSHRPRRTIVFAAFGAEEHALNGSAHLAQNPWPEGHRYTTVINLEKIGRVPEQPLITAGCTTSDDWAQLLDHVNPHDERVECLLPDLIPDTDHYPFGALGIPAMVFGTVHELDTHRPGDDISKLDFEALTRRANYLLEVVESLADRERPLFPNPNAALGTGMIAVVASQPERGALGLGEHGALKVSAILPGLPAANAGLMPGDFIIALDDKRLSPRADERMVHEAVTERGRVILRVRRGASELTLAIQTGTGKAQATQSEH